MKGTQLYLIILLILVTTSLTAASGGQYYAASSSLSYYLGIPHFEDEIPARSSLALSTTIGFLGYQGNNWETVLQAHLTVSDSLPFGNYRARGFNSLGINLASWSPSDRFSFHPRRGSEVNFYKQIEEVFASFSFKLGPQFPYCWGTDPDIPHRTASFSSKLFEGDYSTTGRNWVRYLLFPFIRGDT